MAVILTRRRRTALPTCGRFGDRENVLTQERMLKWFRYDHLPKDLQAVSKPFSALAAMIVMRLKPGAERTVALRKLLESKDAAVRAMVEEKESV